MKTLANGRVRLCGGGPIVAVSTAARIYLEADDLDVTVGAVLDAWSERERSTTRISPFRCTHRPITTISGSNRRVRKRDSAPTVHR